jgi:hypothetical protein
MCILQPLSWLVTRKFNEDINSGFSFFVSIQSKDLEMCMYVKSGCDNLTESIYRYFHSYIKFRHKKKAGLWSSGQ